MGLVDNQTHVVVDGGDGQAVGGGAGAPMPTDNPRNHTRDSKRIRCNPSNKETSDSTEVTVKLRKGIHFKSPSPNQGLDADTLSSNLE